MVKSKPVKQEVSGTVILPSLVLSFTKLCTTISVGNITHLLSKGKYHCTADQKFELF